MDLFGFEFNYGGQCGWYLGSASSRAHTDSLCRVKSLVLVIIDGVSDMSLALLQQGFWFLLAAREDTL